MSSEVKQISGRAVPLRGDDIDTDRIIPARFLKCVTFDGLGEHAFEDDRAQDPNHPFDQSQYQGAKVLVVNRNFGCGSSREHAPQAIQRWGIDVLIGESFAEIFFGNCVALGVPCVTAEAEVVRAIQAAIATNPQLEITVDLEAQTVTWDNQTAAITMGDGPRQMFVSGTWDACGQLVAQRSQIQQTAAKLPYLQWSSPVAIG